MFEICKVGLTQKLWFGMLSLTKQVILSGMVLIAMVVVVLWVLNHNSLDKETVSKMNQFERIYELNIVVFFATLFSTSRSSIMFITDKLLGRRISPSTLGLINVLLKTVCIVLFDFRIIHVGKTNHDTRMMILYADIASNFFNEASQSYQNSDVQLSPCCHAKETVYK
jgi:hypothetical protein